MAPAVLAHPEARTTTSLEAIVIESSVERSAAPRTLNGDQASPPSTREQVADAAFCEVIAEDLGVKTTTARTACIGEPKVRCIRVVEWALRHEPDDPEKRARMILAWAKKRQAGAFRQDGDAEKEIARALAVYWQEHPEKLAAALRASLAATR